MYYNTMWIVRKSISWPTSSGNNNNFYVLKKTKTHTHTSNKSKWYFQKKKFIIFSATN